MSKEEVLDSINLFEEKKNFSILLKAIENGDETLAETQVTRLLGNRAFTIPQKIIKKIANFLVKL